MYFCIYIYILHTKKNLIQVNHCQCAIWWNQVDKITSSFLPSGYGNSYKKQIKIWSLAENRIASLQYLIVSVAYILSEVEF